ncbi:hypothetical protein L6R50_07435 [Myxococcota bacterium]|nr:hypothetical protein [Myxococcota bacterium]
MKIAHVVLALVLGSVVGLSGYTLMASRGLEERLAATEAQVATLAGEVAASRERPAPMGDEGSDAPAVPEDGVWAGGDGDRPGPGFGGPPRGGDGERRRGPGDAGRRGRQGDFRPQDRDGAGPDGGMGRGGAGGDRHADLASLVAEFARTHGLTDDQAREATEILQRMADARMKAMRQARQSGQAGAGPPATSAEEQSGKAQLEKLLGAEKAQALLEARVSQIRRNRAGGRPGGRGPAAPQ